MGLHHDLQLDSVIIIPSTEQEIRQVESFAEEIANEKMTGKLYTMGQVYAGKEMEETVVAMSAEPLAYSLAGLTGRKGKLHRNNIMIMCLYPDTICQIPVSW